MKLKVGMVTEGVVTGIKPYGAFVLLEDGYSGLIHISELSNTFVKDVELFVSVGDMIAVKVVDINITNKQVKLSVKALTKSSVRSNRKYYPAPKLPKMTIGFKSLEKQLPHWIKAQQEETND